MAVNEVVGEIVEALERDMARMSPGERLPSEHALMRRFGATRAAVRRAIEHLERRYLVRRSQGAGTFVNRRIDYLLSTWHAPSMHETVTAAGAVARTFLLDVADREAPPDVADRLEAHRAPCVNLIRLGYIDGDAATYAQEWLAPGVLDEAALRLRAVESLVATLRDAGYDPSRTWSRVSPEFAPTQVEERLGTAPPTATWCVESLTRDGADGRPLLFSRSWLRQDRVRVVVELGRDEPFTSGHGGSGARPSRPR